MSQRYKTRLIRQLLMAAYTLEELRTLCYDEFRPVYEDYGEVKKSELVRHLIEYCDRKGLFEQLFRCIEEDAPEKYATYAGRLWTEEPTATPTPAAAPNVLTLTKPFVMEFVRVPAGAFLMGSNPAKDKYAQADEQPQHAVDLPEFYIGKYSVTNVQYAAFLKATGHKAQDKWRGSQFPQGDATHPATYVSWDDAVAFCRWFSQESGYLVRLPSEAEWEKAARGTDGRIYPWGDQPPKIELCNFGRNVGATTPIENYSPQGDSPYGAVDMAGNVWEWCSTIVEGDLQNPKFKPYPYQVEDEWLEDYLNKTYALRVLRGGSWDNDEASVRCERRDKARPLYGWFGGGVRLALPPI